MTSTEPSARGCRSCRSSSLQQVLSLGELPLANALLTDEDLRRAEARFPLDLAFCPTCGLAQITEDVAPERLFRDYVYRSSVSTTMLSHVKALVERMIASRGLGRDSLVIEVASNDGYLLQYYREQGIPVLGIEPASNIAKLAESERGIPTLTEFFGLELGERLAAEGRRADVVHAHNVFAHVPDPADFAAGLERVLCPGGMAVIEAPYVRDLIEKTEFDTIYHEHFSYFSLTAVQHLVQRHGLAVVDVEHVPIHGGSLRYLLAHSNVPVSENVTRLLQDEVRIGLDRSDFFLDFADRVWGLRDELVALLKRLKAEGKSIAAYGASAKGSTLLNAFGIGSDLLDFVVDRSEAKQGRHTPGNHLPIHAPGALLERMPDYVLLLAWNLGEEILQQERDFLARGGHFIVPVPAVEIV